MAASTDHPEHDELKHVDVSLVNCVEDMLNPRRFDASWAPEFNQIDSREIARDLDRAGKFGVDPETGAPTLSNSALDEWFHEWSHRQ